MWGIPSARSFVVPRLEAHPKLSFARMLRLACTAHVPSWHAYAFCGVAGVIATRSEWGCLDFPPTHLGAPGYNYLDDSISSPQVLEDLGSELAYVFQDLMLSQLTNRARNAQIADTFTQECPSHCAERWPLLFRTTVANLVVLKGWILSNRRCVEELRYQNLRTNALCEDCLNFVLLEMEFPELFLERALLRNAEAENRKKWFLD